MTGRRRWGRALLALSIVGFLTVLSGCSRNSAPTRYKMIVEVMTPTGLKTGSVVREARIRANRSYIPLAQSRPTVDFRGEALAVDIAPRRTLLALLISEEGYVDYAERMPDWLSLSDTPPDMVDGAARNVEWYPKKPSGEEFSAHSGVPLLVTFHNLADSKSVLLVQKINMAAVFGPGLKLQRISVESTRDEVTTLILSRLS